MNRFLNILSIVGLGIAVLIIGVHYADLPARIPTHINGAGDARGYGDKLLVWLPVVIAGWLYFLFTLIDAIPAGMGSALANRQSRGPQWQVVSAGLSIVKVMLVWLVVLNSWLTVRQALGRPVHHPKVYMAIAALLLLGTIGTVIVRAKGRYKTPK